MSRDADARALAAAMPGWDVRTYSEGSYFNIGRVGNTNMVRASFPIPAPDAPLPEALAFVGHLAVALGVGDWLLRVDQVRGNEWWVRFYPRPGNTRLIAESSASDLAWAAVRAALAARGGDMTDDDASPCPRCGEWVNGTHELGVLRHEACGYCAHPSRSGTEPGAWRCDICDDLEGEDSTPGPCDCGRCPQGECCDESA